MNQLPLLYVNHFVNKLSIVSTEIFFIVVFIVFFPFSNWKMFIEHL